MSAVAIDLWWFPLDPPGAECLERATALLGPAERTRLRQFDRPEAAGLFALRRAIRRVILAESLGCGPGEMRFDEPEGAKPRVSHPAADWQFSASDTAGLGVIAVTRGAPVGADVEAGRTVDEAGFGRRILTRAEREMLREMSRKDLRQRVLLRLWTAKEAVLKGIGTGLDLGAMRQIGVSWDPGVGVWQAVSPEIPDGPGCEWNVSFQDLKNPGVTPAFAAIACQVPRPVEVKSAAALMDRHGLR